VHVRNQVVLRNTASVITKELHVVNTVNVLDAKIVRLETKKKLRKHRLNLKLWL